MGLNALICPDRSLSLGLPNHSDVILSTILLQGEILPIAFVINIAHMLQVRTSPFVFLSFLSSLSKIMSCSPLQNRSELSSLPSLIICINNGKIDLLYVRFCDQSLVFYAGYIVQLMITNSKVARTEVGSFIHPSFDSHIEPAKVLASNCHTQLHRTLVYKDFLHTCIEDTRDPRPLSVTSTFIECFIFKID